MTRSFPVRIAVVMVAIVSALVPAWSQSGAARQPVLLGVVVVLATGCQETRGACITGVRAGGAAERAGLQQGDLITRVGKMDINGPETLLDAIQKVGLDDRLDISVRRKGKDLTLPVSFTQADVAGPGSSPAQGRKTVSLADPQPYEVLPILADASAVASRLAGKDTVAWIEGEVLSIVHRDSREAVQMMGSFQSPMTRVPGSDLWMMRLKMRGWEKAFFSLSFFPRSNGAEDSFFGPRAPEAPAKASPLKGRIVQKSIESQHLGVSRGISVYLPPGVAESGSGLPVLFMADGQACETYARIAEPLITSGRVAAFVIVGVHSAAVPRAFDPSRDGLDPRSKEYVPRIGGETAARHMRFFIEEVLPWATRELGVSGRRRDRAVFGYSNGGVFAAYAGVEHGNEFAHSLPFSMGIAVARPSGHRSLPEFHFAAGKLEPGFIGTTREMHGLVKELGAKSTFDEYTSGHDSLMWQVALAEYLPRVFPPRR
jgi:enterochelin esterase-like enzyme